MKRLIGAVMAVALLVSVAPVLAGDSFQALSRLPAGLTPLDDAQLAAVEGGQGIPQDFFFDLNWSAYFLLLESMATKPRQKFLSAEACWMAGWVMW